MKITYKNITLRDYQYSDIDDEIRWKTVETQLALWDGPWEMEKKLAEYVGVKHCITCANGTDAQNIAENSTGTKRTGIAADGLSQCPAPIDFFAEQIEGLAVFGRQLFQLDSQILFFRG